MAHDVFVSYSTEPELSTRAANCIVQELEKRGVRCWIAPRNLDAGEDYMAQLSDRVAESKALVLVFSDEANHSPHVKREVGIAFENDVQIIPFRIHDVQPDRALKYCIGQVHWFDALTLPIEPHIADLADRIQKKFRHGAGASSPEADSEKPALPLEATAAKRRAAWPAVVLGIIAVAVVGGAYFFSDVLFDAAGLQKSQNDALPYGPASGDESIEPEPQIPATEDAILAEFNIREQTARTRSLHIKFSVGEYLQIRDRWDTCRATMCAELNVLQNQLFDVREAPWSVGDVSGVIRIVSAKKTTSLICPWRVSIEEVLKAGDRTRQQQRTYCTSNGFDGTVESQDKVF